MIPYTQNLARILKNFQIFSSLLGKKFVNITKRMTILWKKIKIANLGIYIKKTIVSKIITVEGLFKNNEGFSLNF